MKFIHSGYHNERFSQHETVNLDYVQKYYKYTPDDYKSKSLKFADIGFVLIDNSETWRFETIEERDKVFEKLEKLCETLNLSETLTL